MCDNCANCAHCSPTKIQNDDNTEKMTKINIQNNTRARSKSSRRPSKKSIPKSRPESLTRKASVPTLPQQWRAKHGSSMGVGMTKGFNKLMYATMNQ
jgi:hypothetical protein